MIMITNSFRDLPNKKLRFENLFTSFLRINRI